MNWDAITTCEIVGAIAVVISLLYLAFQTKENSPPKPKRNEIRMILAEYGAYSEQAQLGRIKQNRVFENYYPQEE